eukprot:8583933-Pyramimonas_sp.AAC.1
MIVHQLDVYMPSVHARSHVSALASHLGIAGGRRVIRPARTKLFASRRPQGAFSGSSMLSAVHGRTWQATTRLTLRTERGTWCRVQHASTL